MDNEIQKDQKAQLSLLKSQEKSRELCMGPAQNTTKRVGEPSKPPLWLDPWTPLPSAHVKHELAHSWEQTQEPAICSHSLLLEQWPP